MKKKSNKEAIAISEKENTETELIVKNTQQDNTQIIDSIMHYMAEIKRHRENLKAKGIL